MTAEHPSWRLPPRKRGYLQGASGSARLLGLDAARGLALIGMFVAHVGVTTDEFSPTEGLAGWFGLANGRSSILFALVAGFSRGILSGRTTPHTGSRLVLTRLRILVRALILLGVGALLELLGTPILIILGYYATWFILAIPVLVWPPRRLLTLTAGVAVIGPILHYYLPPLLGSIGLQPHQVRTGNWAVTDFVLTGAYPAVVWMAYILVGLALSRFEWDRARQAWLLFGAGVAAAALGYGASALLTGRRLLPTTNSETWPSPSDLLLAEPHSDTTFEVIGSGGVAIAVVGAFLLLARYAAPALAPLITLGSMSLTIYSLHVVAYWVVGIRTGSPWVDDNVVLAWMIVWLVAVAMAWKLAYARGPLEHWLHVVSVRATMVRPANEPDQPTDEPY